MWHMRSACCQLPPAALTVVWKWISFSPRSRKVKWYRICPGSHLIQQADRGLHAACGPRALVPRRAAADLLHRLRCETPGQNARTRCSEVLPAQPAPAPPPGRLPAVVLLPGHQPPPEVAPNHLLPMPAAGLAGAYSLSPRTGREGPWPCSPSERGIVQRPARQPRRPGGPRWPSGSFSSTSPPF